jgi:hypothetical protein
MSKNSQSQAPSGPQIRSFAVDTSEELKQIVQLVGAASWFSRQSMQIVGNPGTGKTSIMYFAAKQVFGNAALTVYCHPYIQASEIVGSPNPQYVLNRRQAIENNETPWLVDDTPFDPTVEHVLFTEMSRAEGMGADLMLSAIDYGVAEIITPRIAKMLRLAQVEWHPVTFWADSNWSRVDNRTDAREQRFPIKVWYYNYLTDPESVMLKDSIKYWHFDMPGKARIDQVRGWYQDWCRQLTRKDKTFRAIAEVGNTLVAGLPGTDFQTANRLAQQWKEVMYTVGAHLTDDPAFTSLPDEVFEVMCYCYPTRTYEDYLKWRGMVKASVDIVETTISQFESNLNTAWKKTYAEIKREKDEGTRLEMIMADIGSECQKQQDELLRRFPGDKRAEEACNRLGGLYRRMLRMEDLE